MLKLIFTVFDQKANTYMQPFFTDTAGLAERIFMESINGSETQLSKYPADFTMFELGTYDTQTGKFTNHSAPLNRGNALQFVDQKPMTVPPGLPYERQLTEKADEVRAANVAANVARDERMEMTNGKLPSRPARESEAILARLKEVTV